MRRYWIPAEQINPPKVEISGDSLHHIFEVCRQDVGSKFEVLGDGRKAHLIEVLSVEKRKALGKIIETRDIPELPRPHIVLALSFCRYPVMDAVIEKAVELGVSRIQPFFSENSFIRKSESLSENKEERWKKIIVSATQQSGRGDLMTISKAITLSETLEKFNQSPNCQGLFAYEGASTFGIKDKLPNQTQQKLQEYWVFVGSEGGFSQTEVEQFRGVGLEPVTLGEQVLRVETACITLLAVLKYELGQMQGVKV